MIEIIKKLSDMGGISGFEYTVSPHVAELFREYCDKVETDRAGNVVGHIFSKEKNAPTVMIEAHMDGIGLMVKEITDRGFLTFVPIGGIDPRILPAAEVIVSGKENLYGVIGAKPPHLQSEKDRKKAPKIEDMYIDIGLSKEEAEEKVSVGDMVYFKTEAVELLNNRVSGKFLDNRAGVVALLYALKGIQGKRLPFHLSVLIAVQEEVGLRGAVMGTFGVSPDVAIVVDVCHGKTPDSGSDSTFSLGSGTVLSLGPNIHPALSNLMREVAEKENIKVSLDVDGGDTGTDAWAVQVSRTGVATALLSIPLSYMHTTVETLSMDDVYATGELILKTLLNLNAEEFKPCILKR